MNFSFDIFLQGLFVSLERNNKQISYVNTI